MVAKNKLDDVLSWPIVDQLELFDRLQDNLEHLPEFSPLTDDQKRILDTRFEEYERDPSQGSAWDDVEARILALIDTPRKPQ